MSIQEKSRETATAPCGRTAGDCCHPLHLAAERFASEVQAAPVVWLVAEYVISHPGCSALAVYTALLHPRKLVLLAIDLAEAEGLIGRERVNAKRQRFWPADVVETPA